MHKHNTLSPPLSLSKLITILKSLSMRCEYSFRLEFHNRFRDHVDRMDGSSK